MDVWWNLFRWKYIDILYCYLSHFISYFILQAKSSFMSGINKWKFLCNFMMIFPVNLIAALSYGRQLQYNDIYFLITTPYLQNIPYNYYIVRYQICGEISNIWQYVTAFKAWRWGSLWYVEYLINVFESMLFQVSKQQLISKVHNYCLWI